MHLHLTPAEFDDWIASAHKGDRLVYHLGHLMHDRAFRVTLATSGGYSLIHNIPVELLADHAIEQYKAGYVVLVQQRVAEDIYRYLAVRTKKYKKPPLAKKKELVTA